MKASTRSRLLLSPSKILWPFIRCHLNCKGRSPPRFSPTSRHSIPRRHRSFCLPQTAQRNCSKPLRALIDSILIFMELTVGCKTIAMQFDVGATNKVHPTEPRPPCVSDEPQFQAFIPSPNSHVDPDVCPLTCSTYITWHSINESAWHCMRKRDSLASIVFPSLRLWKRSNQHTGFTVCIHRFCRYSKILSCSVDWPRTLPNRPSRIASVGKLIRS